MEATINTVNIELSKYNDLTSKLNEKTALLEQVKSELTQLKAEKASKKEDKILLVETRSYDPYTGNQNLTKMSFDVSNPKTSEELLKIMSKIDTADLSKQMREKETIISNLTKQIESMREQQEREILDRRLKARIESVGKQERELEINKTHREEVEALKTEIADLNKTLDELKLNKTEEQLEVFRQQELSEMKEKVAGAEALVSDITALQNKPFELVKYLRNIKNAEKFLKIKKGFKSYFSPVETAFDKLYDYTKMIKSVGRNRNDRRAAMYDSYRYNNVVSECKPWY